MKMKLALAIARDLQIYICNVTVVKLGTYDLIQQGDFHNNYEFPIMDAFVARERETVYSKTEIQYCYKCYISLAIERFGISSSTRSILLTQKAYM